MHICVYATQEARFILVLSDVRNIPEVPIGSARNQIAIDNTRKCYQGIPKRFFHRNEILNAILWAMIGIA